MSVSKESQCFFIQLQVDSYLDGDLSRAQQDVFMAHVHDCAACARELHYARTVQDTLLDLPLLDIDEAALEPVRRLTARAGTNPGDSVSFWRDLWHWLTHAPAGLRYAVPAVAVTALLLGLLPMLMNEQQPESGLATDSTATPEYTQAEVATALQELNLAIDYLNEVSQRTEVMIGDRFLMRPLRETLDASFEQIMDEDDSAPANGPI